MHSESNRAENARRNYEHYISLARAATQSGDSIQAEAYYQHAEHYYRSMIGNSQEI
jgi:hypothetical protein